MIALSKAEHRALAKELDAIEGRLVAIHAGLRGSHRVRSRTRLNASKAIAAVRDLRLSLVEQLGAETADHARAAYFKPAPALEAP